MATSFQEKTLRALGASDSEIQELLAYNENVFDLEALRGSIELPLPDEPFVRCWRGWQEEALRDGSLFEVLKRDLPQLRFPIREGISGTDAYRAATLRGQSCDDLPEATGLELGRPELLSLHLHPSLAGTVPVIEARGRQEFEALLRALARRNEPSPIPPSQGALMIAGFNNWERLHRLERAWKESPPEARENATWNEEFAQIRGQKHLFQDRLILLSDSPYSSTPAAELDLTPDAWRQASLRLRREHECAHYLTRRLLGKMRNNALDELIADYAGIVAVQGYYRADWFLRFMGLESYPDYRQGGRLEIYRGQLSEGAFRILQTLLKQAAEGLEAFDHAQRGSENDANVTATTMLAIASLRLEDLASEDSAVALERSFGELSGRLSLRF